MSFGDLTQRRQTRAYRERWFRRIQLSVILVVVLAVVGGIGISAWRGPFKRNEQPRRPANELTISFGFSRQPVTRNFAVDVSPPVPPNQTADETVTVRLSSDLRRSEQPGEFPAEQVSVGINRLTPTRVNLTVTANPWTPEKVAAGLYTGSLELRGGGASERIPISIWLRSREDTSAIVAILLLLTGALMGLLVKWITERLTPQAALVRRLTSLQEAIGYREDFSTLPVVIRLRLRALEDQIAREDYAEADASFKYLEGHRERLSLLASQFQILLDQLASQSRQLDRGRLVARDQLLVEGVLDSEYRLIQDLLTRPWEESEQFQLLIANAREARAILGMVLTAISDFIETRHPLLREALSQFQADNFDSGESKYREWKVLRREEGGEHAVAPTIPESAYPMQRETLRYSARQDRQRMKFLFRHARTLAATASIIVVSLVGLKLEYLDDQQFDGALSAWLGLMLWGAVVELSGVSVLDVVGRLGMSGSGASETMHG